MAIVECNAVLRLAIRIPGTGPAGVRRKRGRPQFSKKKTDTIISMRARPLAAARDATSNDDELDLIAVTIGSVNIFCLQHL